MDPVGGILIALTTGYLVAVGNQYAKISLLDKLVPFIAILAPTIYLSNFASGGGYGTVTNLPWGIEIWGARRHPVQLYYFLSSLVVVYFLVFRTRTAGYPPGSKILLFVICTTGYLTLFSSFQDPGGWLLSGLRTFQLLYWVILTASILIYNKHNRGST
jgi:phosphatidylglycerol:prolipoprotein diacylglycerol transferase